ncbi:MAG: hypothetical protein OSB34_12705 [Planktomarina sp.]|nr:hypothetical protein [Planktomarina sp.]
MPCPYFGEISGVNGSPVCKVRPAQIGLGQVGPAQVRNFGANVGFVQKGSDFAICLVVSAHVSTGSQIDVTIHSQGQRLAGKSAFRFIDRPGQRPVDLNRRTLPQHEIGHVGWFRNLLRHAVRIAENLPAILHGTSIFGFCQSAAGASITTVYCFMLPTPSPYSKMQYGLFKDCRAQLSRGSILWGWSG